MKYYISLLAGLVLSSGIVAQQQDSLLRRQMELEREFNPTLQDANKINSLPALREPVVTKASTTYSTWAGRTTPPLEIALPRPGEIMTEIPFSTKRGYLTFNAGNYANMDGAFGYRLIESGRNTLNFSFLHNSTNGDVGYVQDSDPKDNKAYFMDNLGRLQYGHASDALDFSLHASYLHSLFNYYGNTFSASRPFDDKNQQLGVFNLNAGIQSKQNDQLNYKGSVDFKNFSAKYGASLDDGGLSGNQIDALIGLEKPFQDSGSRIGIDGQVLGVFYNTPEGIEMNDFTLVNGSPYIRFDGFNWSAKLGANVLFKFADDNKVYVTPNVHLSWNMTEKSSIYAAIGGGVDDNTFLDMINESRYVSPVWYVKPSFSIVDLEAGVKIGEAGGFRFDLFGGFKKTDNEHFLLLNNPPIVDTGIDWPTMQMLLVPAYGDLTHSHIGGRIHSNIWSPLDISLTVKKHFYTVDNATMYEGLTDINDAKAYNKPGLEADIRATLDIIDDLRFTLNYYFAGDRWSYTGGSNVKMDNINDLNAGLVYRINDAFSVNVKANNLLFRKYDIWYGHPAQGFNAMGGFTFTF